MVLLLGRMTNFELESTKIVKEKKYGLTFRKVGNSGGVDSSEESEEESNQEIDWDQKLKEIMNAEDGSYEYLSEEDENFDDESDEDEDEPVVSETELVNPETDIHYKR